MAKSAQVHRFRDSVAAYLGNGPTTYLEPAEALKLAKALRAVALECRKVPFAQSKVGTVRLELKGKA